MFVFTKSVALIHQILVIVIYIDSIRANCGTPGKPHGGEFSPHLLPPYPENFEVEYSCRDGKRFISWESNKRRCVNGRWVGKFPICGNMIRKDREVWGYKIGNYTSETGVEFPLLYTIETEYQDEVRINNCKDFKSLSSNQTWVFRVLKYYRDVRYVELGFIGWPISNFNWQKETIKLDFGHYGQFDLIKFSQYNWKHLNTTYTVIGLGHPKTYSYSYRYCGSGLIPPYSAYHLDDIKLILMGERFATNVRFCGIDLFTFPKYCGEPDSSLHTRMSRREHFTDRECIIFSCENNYELIGDAELECGEYAHWDGEVPICKPKITCSQPKFTADLMLEVEYQNLETFNYTNLAVPSSVAVYSCKGSTTLLGISQRICSENGTWDSDYPKCITLETETNQRSFRIIIITMIVTIICTIFLIEVLRRIYLKKRKKSNQNGEDNTKGKDNYDDCQSPKEYVNIVEYDTHYEEIKYNSYEDVHYYSALENPQDTSISKAGASHSLDEL